MKIRMYQVLIIFMLLFFVGCNINRPAKSWKPVTEPEIKRFLAEKNVELITQKDIKNKFTVILIESPKAMGYYSLSSLNGKPMVLTSSMVRTDLPLINEYVAVVGNDTPEIPYEILVLNDDELIKKAYKVVVRFSNGFEGVEYFAKKGAIIPNEGSQTANNGVLTITIYDKIGEVLLKN